MIRFKCLFYHRTRWSNQTVQGTSKYHIVKMNANSQSTSSMRTRRTSFTSWSSSSTIFFFTNLLLLRCCWTGSFSSCSSCFLNRTLLTGVVMLRGLIFERKIVCWRALRVIDKERPLGHRSSCESHSPSGRRSRQWSIEYDIKVQFFIALTIWETIGFRIRDFFISKNKSKGHYNAELFLKSFNILQGNKID